MDFVKQSFFQGLQFFIAFGKPDTLNSVRVCTFGTSRDRKSGDLRHAQLPQPLCAKKTEALRWADGSASRPYQSRPLGRAVPPEPPPEAYPTPRFLLLSCGMRPDPRRTSANKRAKNKDNRRMIKKVLDRVSRYTSPGTGWTAVLALCAALTWRGIFRARANSCKLCVHR